MRSAAVINNGLRRYVAYSILNLFIEYEPLCCVVTGFLVMLLIIRYTHVYTVF